MLVNEANVISGVSALKSSCEEYDRKPSQKTALFDEESHNAVFIQIGMKKIPSLNHLENIKIFLPHPCWNDPEDICLFVPDLNKRKPDDDATIHFFKILLQNQDVTVREIITLHQLKTEYHTFESRRRLVGSYSLFLCDGRLCRMMPELLGKIFIQKRKMPINVDLRKPTLIKKRMHGAVSKTSLTIDGHGSSCGCQVANLKQTVDEIVSNVIAALKDIEEKVPGGSENIATFHIKTAISMAIPLYISLESADNVKLPFPKKKEKPVIDELTTDDATSVMVYPSGQVIDFPSNDLDDEAEEEMEQKILRSTRSANKKWFSKKKHLARKENVKSKGINKRREKTEKRKLTKSARLSLKSKQGYKLTQKYEPDQPAAQLLSVKKRNVDMEDETPKKMKLNANRPEKKPKGLLEKKNKKKSKRRPREQLLQEETQQKTNELKGILKNSKNVPETKIFSGKRSKKMKGKQNLMAVMRKSSIMAKHM